MAAKDGYMSMAAAADPSIPAHGRSFGVCCVGEVSRALWRLHSRDYRHAHAVAMGGVLNDHAHFRSAHT